MDETKFDGLSTLIDEVDGAGPATAEQTEEARAEAEALDGAKQWGMVAFAIGRGLSMIAPDLTKVYTEPACQAWGASMQPVAGKYGWNSPANVPEFGLLLASMSLGVPSYLLIRQRLDELKREKAKPAAPGATDGG